MQTKKLIWHIITAVSFISSIVFLIYGIQADLFYSEEALETFLGKFGIWAPSLFIIFQFVQVIFPILPGGIGCLGGILVFGPVWGLIYNYIGICIGSIVAFILARNYGTSFIAFTVSKKMQAKYHNLVNNRRFDFIFTIAIFSPIAPDDYLCFLAGTTKMSLKKFTIIILTGKPLPIAIYSFGLEWLFRMIATWL